MISGSQWRYNKESHINTVHKDITWGQESVDATLLDILSRRSIVF